MHYFKSNRLLATFMTMYKIFQLHFIRILVNSKCLTVAVARDYDSFPRVRNYKLYKILFNSEM